MLDQIKKSYRSNNTQFIIIDKEGIVQESDQTLLEVKSNSPISELHPFFENIIQVLNEEGLTFSCVHLESQNQELICDISISNLEKNNFLIIITDFSKHYKSFQSLAQSRNENAIQKEILTINNQLLKEKEEFKNKFIANFSHEIKSPITSILAFSELLNNTKLKEEQQEYLDVIQSSGHHLKSIINDILDISKVETGKLDLLIEQFNFHKLLEQLTSEYTVKSHEKGLNFKVDIDSKIPEYIVSDKTRIRQIIKNLIDNAIKFTEKGTVSLSIKEQYKRAGKVGFSIIISDTGSGIKKEDQDKIFKRFNRLENAINVDGVGLGLTIVKEMVNLLEGSLYFESQPNKGTSFTINLKANYPVIGSDSTKKTISKSKTLKKNKDKHQILLVEDNDAHQLSIFKFLAQTNNYFLDIVNNGFEAIESVKKNHYDLILMDYKMPLLNGLDAAKAIKNLSDKKKNIIPIILITGNLINSELEEYKGSIFTDLIEKPFDQETLISTIENTVK